MCAQRILRSGPGAEVVRSRLTSRADPRQSSFDLDPPEVESTAEQTIYRLAREVGELRLKLAGAGAPESSDGVTYRTCRSGRGWIDAVDPIALLARHFAARLAEVKCIRSLGPAGDATSDHAKDVNASLP